MKKKSSFFFLCIFLCLGIILFQERIGNAGCIDKDGAICSKLSREAEIRRKVLQETENKKIYPPSPLQKVTEKKETNFHVNHSYKKKTLKKKSSPKRVLNSSRRKIGKTLIANRVATIPITVTPEKTVWIALSNRDINRIVCSDGKITKVFFSREKGVEVKRTETKDEVYIKFKVLEENNPETGEIKRFYAKEPAEFYIRCAGETFSFIAKPQNIISQTVFLVSPKKGIEESLEPFEKLDYDSAIRTIVKAVFTDRPFPSWEKPKFTGAKMEFLENGKKILVEETEQYLIPGLPVLVRVFVIKNTDSNFTAKIDEKIFLDHLFVRNPIAISIRDHTLYPKGNTKAVVIERTRGNL